MQTESDPNIAVVILFYNDEPNVVDVLSSALRQTYNNCAVICVDNASTDQTLSLIQTSFPGLRIIANRENMGYAGAYKAALAQIFDEGYEAAVLLNSDVIVDNNWLAELVRSAYADENIAIAQPKIFLRDGKDNDLANTFGNNINYLGFGFCGHYKKKDSQAFSADREITSASGCCMLIKKEAYSDIGELDDKFFSYMEDQDFSWRARMKGRKIILSAKSLIWHKYRFRENQRNSLKFFLLERNRLYFIFKHYSTKTFLLILPAFLFMEAGILVNSICSGYFLAKIKSYYAFATNISTLKAARAKIQKNRKISDRQLFREFSPTIDFDEIDSPLFRLANLFLKHYYNFVRKLI